MRHPWSHLCVTLSKTKLCHKNQEFPFVQSVNLNFFILWKSYRIFFQLLFLCCQISSSENYFYGLFLSKVGISLRYFRIFFILVMIWSLVFFSILSRLKMKEHLFSLQSPPLYQFLQNIGFPITPPSLALLFFLTLFRV